jgi:hypothetical protein
MLLSKQDEHRLSIFERKILRRIYGSVMDGEDGELELTKNFINSVVRTTLRNSASS